MADDFGESLGTCEVKKITGKAILVATEDYGEVWCPLANIHDDSELYGESKKGDVGKFVVKTWFAEQKGWV
jgi:hypothetical protein